MTTLVIVLTTLAIVIAFYAGRASARRVDTKVPSVRPPKAVAPTPTPVPTSLPPDGDGAADRNLELGFLGVVSHELRTPLTAMQLLLDRLNDSGDELPVRQRKMIERLGSSASRLTDLVDSILYYAHIQSRRLVTSVEPFDLAALASEAAEELRTQAERKSLVLEATKGVERVAIESDPKLVRLVIVNLVANAVKFTEEGSVAITARNEGDRRIVRVADTGRGIPPAEQARIFEAFQSAEPVRNKHHPGFGLGLSLARCIVESLGGRITVTSEMGRGSAFELSLPAVATGEARAKPHRGEAA